MERIAPLIPGGSLLLFARPVGCGGLGAAPQDGDPASYFQGTAVPLISDKQRGKCCWLHLVSAADSPSPETRSIQGSGKPHSKSQMAQGQIAFPEKPTLDSTVRSRASSLELTSHEAELGVILSQGEG